MTDERARRRLVALAAIVGAAQLGLSLHSPADSRRFYGLTGGVAATWLIAGAMADARPSGARRSVVRPIVIGVAAFAAFYTGALVARRIPLLGKAIGGALGYAHHGTTAPVLATALLNGVAEEVFFRGAVFDIAGDSHPIITSTAVYTAVTAATRNPALVLASVVMGALFAWQRRTSGGVLEPMVTHLTWSTLMVLVLPRRWSAQ